MLHFESVVIHGSVEDTKLSTNKQHSLSLVVCNKLKSRGLTAEQGVWRDPNIISCGSGRGRGRLEGAFGLCLAMSIITAVARAHARPMAARLK